MTESTSIDMFNPTEEHAMLRATLRTFVREQVEPQAEEHDQTCELNLELLCQCGELGLLGITIGDEHGGAGMDTIAAVIAHEELARSDPGFTLGFLAHSILFVHNFFHNANAEQRERFLPKALSGEWIGCMGMTEPGAGTDVLGMSTTARPDGDGYVLNGCKTFITNAPDSRVFLVYAKLNGAITAFLIERDFEGFSVGPKMHKMGMCAAPMAELFMDDCVVPATHLLGEPGGGLTNMMRNLEIERLTLSSMSLGIAERCLDDMIDYSVQRKAFGKPIHEFGQIQRFIAESYARTQAARTFIYATAQNVKAGVRNRIDSDAAKLLTAPIAKEVADNAMQVLGGYGYCRDFKVERFLRDAKLLEIGGGTLESHQKNITRDLTRNRQHS